MCSLCKVQVDVVGVHLTFSLTLAGRDPGEQCERRHDRAEPEPRAAEHLEGTCGAVHVRRQQPGGGRREQSRAAGH